MTEPGRSRFNLMLTCSGRPQRSQTEWSLSDFVIRTTVEAGQRLEIGIEGVLAPPCHWRLIPGAGETTFLRGIESLLVRRPGIDATMSTGAGSPSRRGNRSPGGRDRRRRGRTRNARGAGREGGCRSRGDVPARTAESRCIFAVGWARRRIDVACGRADRGSSRLRGPRRGRDRGSAQGRH